MTRRGASGRRIADPRVFRLSLGERGTYTFTVSVRDHPRQGPLSMFRPIIGVSSFFVAACAYSATIHVPGDHRTIQEGIDAALDGDVVQVAAGTYQEKIDFNGKAIRVAGAGARRTTIDPSKASTGRASVSWFHNQEGPNSVLEGFTLTGGNSRRGAGLRIIRASPTISKCTITGNLASSYGGGAYIREGGRIGEETT